MYTINMDRERANTKRMIRKKVISPEKDLRYLLPFGSISFDFHTKKHVCTGLFFVL